jgi:cytochrome c heme-lyase
MSADPEKEAKAQKLFARLSPVLSSAPDNAAGAPSACPVSPSAREVFNPKTGLPADLEKESSKLSSSSSLSSTRQQSSIPMADFVPKHQEENGSSTWLYPSEAMFFKAMQKKGWDPHEEDMKTVVSIHNSVNERAWREVLTWERMHATECAEPRLKKFTGRPSDYSPKARLLNALGFALPFDRHDWVVDRCGKEVRYVIDFYSGMPRPGEPASVAMTLDVRPALDSFEALWDRFKVTLHQLTRLP